MRPPLFAGLAGVLCALAFASLACAPESTDVPPLTPTGSIAASMPDVVDAGPTDANADLATVDGSLNDPAPSTGGDGGAADPGAKTLQPSARTDTKKVQ